MKHKSGDAELSEKEKIMVRHVILWQLKDELSDEEKAALSAEIRAGLEGLQGKIDGLTEIHVRTEHLPSSNADLMLDSTFVSEEALKAYSANPLHVAIAGGIVAPNAKTRVAFDFEE